MSNCLLYLHLSSIQALNAPWIRCCPSVMGGAVCFTEFTDSNANLIQKYSYKYTQK